MENGRAAGIVSRIDADSFIATTSSPALRTVLVSWSACMAGHGYHFSTPLAALASANLGTAEPTAAEIALRGTAQRIVCPS